MLKDKNPAYDRLMIFGVRSQKSHFFPPKCIKGQSILDLIKKGHFTRHWAKLLSNLPSTKRTYWDGRKWKNNNFDELATSCQKRIPLTVEREVELKKKGGGGGGMLAARRELLIYFFFLKKSKSLIVQWETFKEKIKLKSLSNERDVKERHREQAVKSQISRLVLSEMTLLVKSKIECSFMHFGGKKWPFCSVLMIFAQRMWKDAN